MLVSDRQSDATAQPHEAVRGGSARAARIQLRLQADGQMFDLPTGKTTIGSSPRCNVRIAQPGVQPLHCLIVDGVEGLRVRSWVNDTTLNGDRFEESALAVGDCLCLGPVALEVVDPRASMPQTAAVTNVQVESTDDKNARAGRAQARARSRRLLSVLRRERTNYRELSQQVAKLQESHLDAIAEQNELGSKLEMSFAELAKSQQQLGELQAVETERQQLAEHNEQLEFELGELSKQISELTERYSEAARERQNLEQEHVRLQAQHQEVCAANEQIREQVNAMANEKVAADHAHAQLTARNEQLGFEIGELSAQINELTFGHADVTGERQRLAEAHVQLQTQHEEVLEANRQLANDVVQITGEKAAAEEQNRQLSEQSSKLQKELDHLAEQKAQLEEERAGLCQQNEQLLGEARELNGEYGSLSEERTALYHERSELRQQNEELRIRIAQLNDENSVMAVGRLTLEETHDRLGQDVKQLQEQLAQLSEQNSALARDNVALADENSRLVGERDRLAEIEREASAAVAGRENASAELYRALLQLAEMEDRDLQNKAVVESFASLSKEHDQLREEADQLKQQIAHLHEERAGAEIAWRGLSDEATTLSELQQRLAQENAELICKLGEAQSLLEKAQHGQANLSNYSVELEQERAARLEAQASIAAAIADGERRLAEQENHFAERAQKFTEQSGQFNALSHQHAEQVREYADSICSLERQLAEACERYESLAQARGESQLQLADATSHGVEQARRIEELETKLAEAEERALRAAEFAASSPTPKDDIERASLLTGAQPVVDSSLSQNLDELAPGVGEAWCAPEQEVNATVGADEPHDNSWLTATGTANRENEGEEAIGFTAQEPSEIAATVSWRAVAETPALSHSNADNADFDSTTTVEPTVSKPAHQPPSFIDRYSHMFAEDGGAANEKTEYANSDQKPKAIVPVTSEFQSAKPERAAIPHEDEDSIEQYMAKLLQRVRGDSQGSPMADNQPSGKPLNAPASRQPAALPKATISEAQTLDDGKVDATELEGGSGELMRRRVSTPIPVTNLGALRALANETARLAISRHELRKLRQNAVTKTIVATLAGMTSLWLMLDASDWRSLQFITACGSLVVAAYWTGEAFRTLLCSLRITASEGTEEVALPIDMANSKGDSEEVAI